MTTILVIEDEQAVRDSLVDLLNAEGFTTVDAENGEIGLQLATRILPDLILCDIKMPAMTGYEVIKVLKQRAATASIPFIFLTASNTNQDFRHCMQLGADDYLQKPCNPDELISAITARLANKSAITAAATENHLSSSSHDGLLNYFYQELRNPLSGLNNVIYLLQGLKTVSPSHPAVKYIQTDYIRELSVLQEVIKLQSLLPLECRQLLQACHLEALSS
ncbi:response regulator [filamentous cyanobacterium LEGE 11480]|uniref:Response regulator n=1 Tax=Romeriopsis navalis LEGE 11480 TaxID=2777977 RepID=A0A928VUA9_9CYAN|nr:response regulator [Romeriopsis navalis]MBE9032199.1 response regulator [Romeriopsis navalis LEGE 11480]